MHANLSTQELLSASTVQEPRTLQAKRPLKRQAAGTLVIALAITLTTGLINPVYQRAWAVNTPSKPQHTKAAAKPKSKEDKKTEAKPAGKTASATTKNEAATKAATDKAEKPTQKPVTVGNAPLSSPGHPTPAQQPVAQSNLFVFQPKDLSTEQLQNVVNTLNEGNVHFKQVSVLDLKAAKGGYVMVPLVRSLDSLELDGLQQFLTNGGKLVLLPPEDVGDTNIQALFQQVKLPLDTINFASQSLDLKTSLWKKAAKNSPNVQGNLPIGSQVLTIKPSPSIKVLAMWGEDFPAIMQSDSAILLNWQWGQELATESNVSILSELTGITPGKIAKKPSDTNASPFGFLAPNGFSQAEAWSMTPAQFEQNKRILSEYKTNIYDAIETALMLDINLSIKKIQQNLIQAEFEKTQFENNYDLGRFAEAQASYRKAKKLMLDALSLTSPSPRIEGRAIWLDRGTIVDSGSPEGLRKVLLKLKSAGINVIYFETVNAGFSMYPSQFTKQNPLIDGWDPLATAIAEGHKLGMEVHAWVWCFAVGNKRHNPIIGKDLTYPGPILEDSQMMSEALRGATGNLTPNGKQHEFWLSPASPKGRQFLSDLYAEIVSKYDVDGLNLDYIRFPFQKPGNLMGYDPVTRARFAQSTGLSLDHLNDNTYRVWIAWKTYQVSSFVHEISDRMKAIKPNLKISADVFALPRASRLIAIQQDWETWVENGWIDILSPMSYTTSPKVLQKTFESVENGTKKRALVYPGIAINKLDSDQLLRQLDALREKGALGSTIFAMAHLDDTKVDALGNGPYKEKNILSPHKDPVHATLNITNDYKDKFNKLLRFQELNGMSGSQLAQIQQYLSAFQTSLDNLNNIAPGVSSNVAIDPQISLQTAKTNLTALNQESNRWLTQEKATHPFRYQYFNELLLRLDQMVDYLSAYYQPRKMENLQATFMLMLEEEKNAIQIQQQNKTAPPTLINHSDHTSVK